MSFYLEIRPIQEPFDLGLDDEERAKVVFNVSIVKTPSVTLEEELMAVLVAAGVGVVGQNVFSSTSAAVPRGGGPYLSVISTGGAPPLWNQNTNAPAYQRPSAQIVVRASTYLAARAMARAAYDALSVVRNATVNP